MPTQNRSHERFVRHPALLGLGCLTACLFWGSQALAFDLDFLQDESGGVSNDNYIKCDMSYLSDRDCGSRDDDEPGAHIDGTGFLQQMIVQGGVKYWHIIVGDYLQDDFVQEVFIKASSGNPDCNDSGRGGWGSSGDSTCSDSRANTNDVQFNTNNPYDPNTSKTGTGTANPNSTIFRQLLSDSEMTYEVLKDSFSQKHKISQSITNAEIDIDFIADMRGKNFSNMTAIDPTSANYTNTMSLSGADAPTDNEGNFDTKTASPVDGYGLAVTPHVTAGGYTYSTGSGFGGSGGTYTFVGGGTGYNNIVDWSGMCDPSQNTNWSGNGACENGSGGGGGGGW